MTPPTFRPIIHRYSAGATGAFVNAYLVETENAIVAIDGTLTVSDGRAIRHQIDALQKPLDTVLLTHAHPDHYGGLIKFIEADDTPVIAIEGVNEVIRRDDATKEELLRPMFDDEWATERMFPNTTVNDGENVTVDGVTFTVTDLGPGESPHDSMWTLEGEDNRVFVADLVYNHMHSYLADGYYEEWLANIEQLRGALDEDTTLYMGHGQPGSIELLDWQHEYIATFVEAVKSANWSDRDAAREEVTSKMVEYLPVEHLLFLMDLSIEPLAQKQGLID